MQDEEIIIAKSPNQHPGKEYYDAYREELIRLVEAKNEEEIKAASSKLEEILQAIRSRVIGPNLELLQED